MSRGIPTVAAGLVLVAAVAVPATEPVAFKIIVNAKVTGGTIARDAVAQVYLGKARRWADGTTVVAVDLSSTSAVRQAFSEAVLAMPVDAVKNYWLRMLAKGKRPPVTKQSDDDVIAFVAAEPGGIGYVAEATPVPATVRTITVHP